MRALVLLLICVAAGYGVWLLLDGEADTVSSALPDLGVESIPDVVRTRPEALQGREGGRDEGLLEAAPGIPSVGVIGVDKDPTAPLDWGEWREQGLPPRDDRRTLTGVDFLEASKGRLPIRFATARLLEDFRAIKYRQGERIETHQQIPLGEIYTLISEGRLHFEEREAYLFIGLPPDEE